MGDLKDWDDMYYYDYVTHGNVIGVFGDEKHDNPNYVSDDEDEEDSEPVHNAPENNVSRCKPPTRQERQRMEIVRKRSAAERKRLKREQEYRRKHPEWEWDYYYGEFKDDLKSGSLGYAITTYKTIVAGMVNKYMGKSYFTMLRACVEWVGLWMQDPR